MCTREDVRQEIQSELKKVMPSTVTKAVAGTIVLLVASVFSWLVTSELNQKEDMAKVLHYMEEQKKISENIVFITTKLNSLNSWQLVHDQYKSDKEVEIRDRFSDVHKILDTLQTLINIKADDRWRKRDATARIEFEDFRYQSRVKEINTRFNICSKRLDWLELQFEK